MFPKKRSKNLDNLLSVPSFPTIPAQQQI